MNFMTKISNITKEFSSVQKPIFIISLIIGAIYLNTYLSGFGIPFPLDLSILPTALLVISCFSVLITLITSIYLLLVALINVDPWETKYKRIINTNRTRLYAPKLRNYFVYALVSYLLPVAVFLVTVLNYNFSGSIEQTILLGFFLTWAIICSSAWAYDANLSKKEATSFIFKMSFHLISAQAVSITSIIILISIISSKTTKIADATFFIIIAVYLLINTACILPSFSRKKFQELHDTKNNLNADDLINKSQLTPTYFVIGFIVFISLLPPFAFHIGEIPLKLMNIGGNIEFITTDARRQCDSWPSVIIDEIDEKQCQSKKGHLIIQLSDRAFAIFENKNGKPILVSLNLSKAAIISLLPDDSRYKVIFEKMKEKSKANH